MLNIHLLSFGSKHRPSPPSQPLHNMPHTSRDRPSTYTYHSLPSAAYLPASGHPVDPRQSYARPRPSRSSGWSSLISQLWPTPLGNLMGKGGRKRSPKRSIATPRQTQYRPVHKPQKRQRGKVPRDTRGRVLPSARLSNKYSELARFMTANELLLRHARLNSRRPRDFLRCTVMSDAGARVDVTVCMSVCGG